MQCDSMLQSPPTTADTLAGARAGLYLKSHLCPAISLLYPAYSFSGRADPQKIMRTQFLAQALPLGNLTKDKYFGLKLFYFLNKYLDPVVDDPQ